MFDFPRFTLIGYCIRTKSNIFRILNFIKRNYFARLNPYEIRKNKFARSSFCWTLLNFSRRNYFARLNPYQIRKNKFSRSSLCFTFLTSLLFIMLVHAHKNILHKEILAYSILQKKTNLYVRNFLVICPCLDVYMLKKTMICLHEYVF